MQTILSHLMFVYKHEINMHQKWRLCIRGKLSLHPLNADTAVIVTVKLADDLLCLGAAQG